MDRVKLGGRPHSLESRLARLEGVSATSPRRWIEPAPFPSWLPGRISRSGRATSSGGHRLLRGGGRLLPAPLHHLTLHGRPNLHGGVQHPDRRRVPGDPGRLRCARRGGCSPVPGERSVRALHPGGPGGIPARGGHHQYLAGRRSGRLPIWGLEAYCRTPSFARGLRRLKALGAGSPTAILCAERLPWRCHRRFIATALRGRGWEVLHILEPDRTWAPAEGQEG